MIKLLRGITTDQYKTIAKFAAFLALAGAIVWIAMSAYQWAYKNGVADEALVWTTAQNAQIIAANAEIKKRDDKIRADEQTNAEALFFTSKQYQENLTNEKAKLNDVIRRYRAGAIVMREPTENHGADRGDGKPPETGADPSGYFSGEKSGLSGAGVRLLSSGSSEFILTLASEADEVALQLAACQAVAIADRQLCR